ncbi:GNAT family N-acetyltransferase [Vogesella indigofera]|uniref:GNAT family N-acetyltransferase n=1 Tax=Vogesella indigofera TaxID=45465 RepID=UPI0035AEFFE4
MHCRFHTAIDDIAANLWDALNVTGSPFLSHAFLAAAERHGAVAPALGWQPAHVTLHADDGSLLGAQPLYLRTHSFGDFSHDWAWADAYQRLGQRYYPKLVCGIPYTPASGARQLIHPDAARASVSRALLHASLQLATGEQASSLQYLYLDDDAALRAALASQGFLLRRGCQFHWHNAGYRDFDDFLATFSADKRKKVKRERRRVAEAGLRIETRHGDDIDAALWQQIYPHYVSTFRRFGNHPAFSLDFFREVGRTLARQLVVFLARDASHAVVAAAICYRSNDTLYGRHWGAAADYHSLHFALCFYEGIDYCIREGLQHFEPGAQGEHKVSRGFVPQATWSAFHIADPRLRGMIADFLQREQQAVAQYQDEMAEHLPFRQPG